jgi:hypothetical protein
MPLVDARAFVGVVDVPQFIVSGDRFDLTDAAEGSQAPCPSGAIA